MKKAIILTNGPGEVWGWARPLTAELQKRGFLVSLWLLACPSAGEGKRDLAAFFGPDEIHGPCSAVSTFWEFHGAEGNIVIQLGGDLAFGKYLSSLLGVPLVCYAYGAKKGMENCISVFSAFSWMADKIADEIGCSVELVGDLTLDSLDMDISEDPWNSSRGTRIVLFPGSRPKIRKKGILFMKKFVAHLSEKIPDLHVRTPFLPNLDDDERKRWEDAGLCPVTSGTGAVLKEAHIAVTQPGTNNFEIMHSGTPAVVALPFEFLDVVPVQGLKGIVTGIPGFGPWVKKKWLRRMDKSVGYMSWPNRMAGKEILTEVRGDLSPYDLGELVASLLSEKGKLLAQRRELLLMSSRSPRKASSNICDIVERLV